MMTWQVFVNMVAVGVFIGLGTGNWYLAMIPMFVGDAVMSILRKEK